MHNEKHQASSEKIRDFIIGMADGLTVPFALSAGLSGAELTNKLIVTAGLAEIAAGSIAMALGGYLASQTEIEHYQAEKKREMYEIEKFPEVEKQEVVDVLEEFGLPAIASAPVVDAITQDKKRWLNFMMKFELGLNKPNASRLYTSPLIIGSAYIMGGIVPLIPYMIYNDGWQALQASSMATAVALFVFGIGKGYLTGCNIWKSAWQTLFVGGAAAIAAYGIASLF